MAVQSVASTGARMVAHLAGQWDEQMDLWLVGRLVDWMVAWLVGQSEIQKGDRQVIRWVAPLVLRLVVQLDRTMAHCWDNLLEFLLAGSLGIGTG